MKIHWSEQARLQLRTLLEYISLDSPGRAEAFIGKIESKTLRLKRFPFSGRIVSELRHEPNRPREIMIDDYRLVYRIHVNAVEITHFFHGRRQLQKERKPLC
jgi:toxin ParE1/3/4